MKNNMKKIIIIIIGLTLTLPTMASAASFVVNSTASTYNVGDIITVSIAVNPTPNTSYTSMFDASFSTDTLEVVSFSMNDKMLAIKQLGYDAIDNNSGLLIKTGGYPGGVNTVTNFGTLVLKAKKEGVGTLTINDNSKLLDENNIDRQSGTQTISFNIGKVVTTQAPVTTLKPTKVMSSSTPTSTMATTTEKEIVKVSELLSINNLLLVIVVLLVIIIGLIVAYFVKVRKLLK